MWRIERILWVELFHFRSRGIHRVKFEGYRIFDKCCKICMLRVIRFRVTFRIRGISGALTNVGYRAVEVEFVFQHAGRELQ
jgi:hypothetical protein